MEWFDWTCSQVSNVNPVDGSFHKTMCSLERNSLCGKCGPEGKLFVSRKEREAEINMDEPRERERGIPADRQVWEEDHESTD